MKTIEIIGKNFRSAANTRIACRGLVVEQGRILLSHEINTDWWMLPGGGLEGTESIEDCCIREVLEETGYQVTADACFLTLKEYYGDWCYITHFFRCTVTGQGKRQLTELEASRGLTPEWVSLEEALDIFGSHESFAGINEEKRGLYLREYRALKTFLET